MSSPLGKHDNGDIVLKVPQSIQGKRGYLARDVILGTYNQICKCIALSSGGACEQSNLDALGHSYVNSFLVYLFTFLWENHLLIRHTWFKRYNYLKRNLSSHFLPDHLGSSVIISIIPRFGHTT